MKLALKWFVPFTLAAMGLAWVSERVAVLLGFELPDPQPLVQLFTNPNVSWAVKAKYAALVMSAPVYEEIIFRMGLFKFLIWVRRKCDARRASRGMQVPQRTGFPVVAALISGALFAAAHFHAATFAPLWFLGVAFAWLYWKGGTILSPILCHFLFNLIELSLCLIVGIYG